MRDFGVAVSGFAHIVLLAAAFIALPSAKPMEAPAEDTLPVEIITPEQFSAITKGEKTAKPAEKPVAKVDKVAPVEKPPVEDPSTLVQREAVAPPPDSAPMPEPRPPVDSPPPQPEPKPEKLADAKPEPKPPEKTDTAKLDELALRAAQEPDPPKPEPKPKQDPPKPVAEKKPDPKKPDEKKPDEKKPVKQAADQTRKYDPAKVAALLSKDRPARAEQTGDALSQTASLGSSRGTAPKLSLSQRNALIGAIMTHVSPCWSPPAFAADARSLAVVVAVDLSPTGLLADEPSIVAYPAGASGTAAAGAAVRALKRCITEQSPLQLPPDLYESWRALEINFDPREMAGG